MHHFFARKIVNLLFFFGANPHVKDTWGRTAYYYVKDEEIMKIFKKYGCGIADSPATNNLELFPPPRGFEEFFAKVEQDPLASSSGSEARWLCRLGSRKLRTSL